MILQRITLIFFLIFLCYSVRLFATDSSATVFYTSNAKAIDPLQGVHPATVQYMVDHLIMAMTQCLSVPEAWASLVKVSDRVGIKVSTTGRSISGTHPAVVEAIARGLMAAGIPREQILVWDRNLEDLLATGYTAKSPYYVLRWVDPNSGYDPLNKVSSPIIGKLMWGDSHFGKRKDTRLVDWLAKGEQLSSDSFYAKILTRQVDKIINVPSLLDSYLTGIYGALVNMTLPNMDNWRRFTKEPGDSYIAEIYADEMIRPKVVLTLLDGLVLQFAGGPYPNPNYTVIENTLFASFDPVAIDTTVIQMIDEMRVLNRLPKSVGMAGHVSSAAQLGLGQSKDIILKHIGAIIQ